MNTSTQTVSDTLTKEQQTSLGSLVDSLLEDVLAALSSVREGPLNLGLRHGPRNSALVTAKVERYRLAMNDNAAEGTLTGVEMYYRPDGSALELGFVFVGFTETCVVVLEEDTIGWEDCYENAKDLLRRAARPSAQLWSLEQIRQRILGARVSFRLSA